MAASNAAIIEEIEALQAIMPDEVTVLQGHSGMPDGVEVTVVPATGQNIEEQHVRVTLVLSLPPEYPDTSPSITLRNPRGVDDYILKKIHEESRKKCEEYLGCPVIYELIEVVRENLTANNTPSCPCAICLYGFTDSDIFTKTPCFHYFHSYCLGRYILKCEEEAAAEEEEPQPAWMAREKKQLVCPVCRDPIQQELSSQELLMSAPPEEDKCVTEFQADDPEIVAMQQRMAVLYLQQKEKGGIIDLEEEKNRFLVSSNRVDSCEGLEESAESEGGSNPVRDVHYEAQQGSVSHVPTAGRRGGRPTVHRSHVPKSHGGHGHQYWRSADQGDIRHWQGNRGSRGGSGGRGRSGNARSAYPNHRIIAESHHFNASEYKSAHIENACPTKGHQGKRDQSIYQNGSSNTALDNHAESAEIGNNTGGGVRRGPKNPGNRQRYGSGRGRGRGPPPGFAPPSIRHSDQDWS